MEPPPDSLNVPRFCGVAGLMRLRLLSDPQGLDVAIMGLPSDNGSPFRTGARFGPQAIRAASVMLRPINPYRGNVDVFAKLRVADLGDASVVPGYMPPTLDLLEQAIASVVDAAAMPLLLGGDHGVSIAALRAVARRYGPLALVHFDAHSDTWESYFGGERHSAGTPFRRAVEEGLVDPACSMQLGLRGSLFRPEDIEQSRRLGYEVCTTDEMLAKAPAELADRIARRVGGAPVYLSFDLDVVDPGHAPGVQTPEVGGPTSREMLAILRALRGLRLVGADVVECNPLYDGPGAVTALLAATIAAEILAMRAIQE
jgi:agmatinase